MNWYLSIRVKNILLASKVLIIVVLMLDNFMLKHFELVKCSFCCSFCSILLIFLYGIKGCFLSKIYGLNILLNQHPTHCCSNGDRTRVGNGIFGIFETILIFFMYEPTSYMTRQIALDFKENTIFDDWFKYDIFPGNCEFNLMILFQNSADQEPCFPDFSQSGE